MTGRGRHPERESEGSKKDFSFGRNDKARHLAFLASHRAELILSLAEGLRAGRE